MFNRLPGAMLVIGAFAPLKKGPRLLPCSLAAYPANYARVTPSFNPAQPVAELVCDTSSILLWNQGVQVFGVSSKPSSWAVLFSELMRRCWYCFS
jgi:hypothetical protein